MSDQEPSDKGGDVVGIEFAEIANEEPTHANTHALNNAICGIQEVITGESSNVCVWKRLREPAKEAWIVVIVKVGM